eukprot:9840585-Alexandrium_andersonii.AAC.1
MLPEDFELPPFATEPSNLRAARSWGCPSDEVASRIAVHLPDCGLCREHGMFLNHHECLHPGTALIPRIDPPHMWPDEDEFDLDALLLNILE